MTTARRMILLTGNHIMDSGRRTQGAGKSLALSPESCVLSPRWGFTLIELLVVMAIVGLLVATSVPALSRYAGQGRLKAAARMQERMLRY